MPRICSKRRSKAGFSYWKTFDAGVGAVEELEEVFRVGVIGVPAIAVELRPPTVLDALGYPRMANRPGLEILTWTPQRSI